MMHTVTGENSKWGVLPRFLNSRPRQQGPNCLPVLLDRNAVPHVFCLAHDSARMGSADH